MATKVWEVLNGTAMYSAYGDTAEDVAKALLKQSREYTGKAGASAIRIDVYFNGEDGSFIGGLTVSE